MQPSYPVRSSQGQSSPADLKKQKQAQPRSATPRSPTDVRANQMLVAICTENMWVLVTQQLPTANVSHASTLFAHHPGKNSSKYEEAHLTPLAKALSLPSVSPHCQRRLETVLTAPWGRLHFPRMWTGTAEFLRGPRKPW